MSESKLDTKTLIGWVIIILISVFTSSATSTLTKDQNAQDEYHRIDNESKVNATQQVEINQLKDTQRDVLKLMKSIKSSSEETHDNVLILMTQHGLTPIKNKQNEEN